MIRQFSTASSACPSMEPQISSTSIDENRSLPYHATDPCQMNFSLQTFAKFCDSNILTQIFSNFFSLTLPELYVSMCSNRQNRPAETAVKRLNRYQYRPIVTHPFSQTRLGKNGSPVGEQLVLVSIDSCQHPMTSQRTSQIYSPALTTVWIGFPCVATSHLAKPVGDC